MDNIILAAVAAVIILALPEITAIVADISKE